MRLRKGDSERVWSSIFVQNHVLAKGNIAVIPDLLVPGETIAMSIDGGNDIIETVAVCIINQHLSCGVGKMERMLLPDGVVFAGSRLFPPAILFNNIDATITVDVAA